MNSLAKEEFLSVETNEDLANYLGISLRTLAFYAYSEKNFYKKYRIQKRTENRIGLFLCQTEV